MARAGSKYAGPWDLAALRARPQVDWLDTQGPVRSLLYEGEPYRGVGTRVFAYYALPERLSAPVPGMVLVHGGGGRAFRQWAELWAQQGYAALAMDLSGRDPEGDERRPDAGPIQDHEHIFQHLAEGLDQVWPYHAVSAVLRGVSLMASQPEVDSQRIGITGISWGGYVTCVVAGLDERLRFAVPVYGCGFLHENSAWLAILDALPPAERRAWIENYDPSRYLSQARLPMFWLNGTNDAAYPLDSYQKSLRLAPGTDVLRITVAMPHGHEAGWAPAEIGLYADERLRGGRPLPRLRSLRVEGNVVCADAAGLDGSAQAYLHFTSDGGDWQQRRWRSVAARVEGAAGAHRRALLADLPVQRPLALFMTATDARPVTVSTDLLLSDELPLS